MFGTTGYEWLKSLHVIAAVTWVGGNIGLQILATRIRREGDPRKMFEMAGHFEFIGTRIFTPASVVVVGLGVWMVLISDWSFGQFWILAALVMFGYSAVTGAFYLGPNLGKIKRAYAAEGPTQELMAMIERLFVFSRIELVLLILIVFDMVLKPGT